MVYTEKELRELKELKFNNDVTLPDDVESVELSQLDKDKVYLVKVEIENLDANVEQICFNLKKLFTGVGITNIIIVPTLYGKSAINVFELEPNVTSE